jgi:uncharacterized protein (TIGR03118 family)
VGPCRRAPFDIKVIGRHVFVTFASPAPVNGNDSPTGGYVDEFDLDGKLVARVDRMGPLNEPWGLALAPSGFGRFAGRLLVGNFGSGRFNAYRPASMARRDRARGAGLFGSISLADR